MELYFPHHPPIAYMLFKLRAIIHYSCIDQEINLVNSNWDYFLKTNKGNK